MDNATIISLLQNAGIKVFGMDSNFIYFQDPSCILPAFDSILHYAWIVILVLTAIMLFGWGLLYIKNGTNINNLFNNAKSLILVFMVLSVVKPIVNLIWHDDLFARGCDTKQVSLTEINKLTNMRKQVFAQSDEAMLYESFDVFDSGAVYNDETSPNTSYQNINYNTANASGTINTTNTAYAGSRRTSGTGANQNTSYQNINYNTTNASGATNPAQGTRFVGVEGTSNNVIYVASNGGKTARIGGSRTWRNNNPGAIRSTQKYGSIGSSGGFAVFPDEETGMRAIVSLLRSKHYNNLSIKDAIYKWAPSSDHNNPERYAKHVSQMTGLAPDRKIGSLSDTEIRRVADAIRIKEGWTPGTKQQI